MDINSSVVILLFWKYIFLTIINIVSDKYMQVN